jgi:ABC-type antimicrobial peptide transport system permease subunit
VRFSFAGVLAPGELGEFSVQPQQGTVRAAFVSLSRLQAELGQSQKVNTVLLAPGEPAAEERLRAAFTLEDLGFRVRSNQFESEAGLLDPRIEATARELAAEIGLPTHGVFSYLANTIRSGNREVPYSLVTATDLEGLAPSKPGGAMLNDWTARELNARAGDVVELEYYLWRPEGGLTTGSAKFQVSAVVPIRDAAADRSLAPEYPGITDSDDVSDWDPPFPIDLSRIRLQDEDYWDRYRATPKAFVRLEEGQRLWQSRYGKLTSLRFESGEALERFRSLLRQRLNPLEAGFTIFPAREQGLAASQGTTDFGEYFVYFSFFLVISALLLAALFFRLGVEQRIREIGTLEAAGFSPAQVRRVFTLEGAFLALAGSVLGMALSVAFASGVLYGLRTWWFDAVGTRVLSLHINPISVLAGGAAGVVAAILSVWWTLFSIRKVSARQRLAGVTAPQPQRAAAARHSFQLGWTAAVTASALLYAVTAGVLPVTGGFFGAGALLLTALLFFVRMLALRRPRGTISGPSRLGFRSISYRPGRTVLCTALIASATFIIVAVDAFRLKAPSDVYDPRSGSAGFPLVGESSLPLYHNPATEQGREELNLGSLTNVEFVSFRLRPGDDVSCLNLYQPRNPRVLGAPSAFIKSAQAGDSTWRLLEEPPASGAVPAIVAANSLTYVLHRKVGDEFALPGSSVRFRIAGTLADTVFQRELIISEQNFRSLFPDHEGYRIFLAKAPPNALGELTAKIEEALADYGMDVVSARDQLEEFHRVENTYLSTFQALGALGLLLGTVGLAVVMLRNVLERRRELALLRAVGYRSGHLARIVLAENVLVLVLGLGCGTVAALVAILPAFTERGGHLSAASLAWLLVPVFAAGLLSSLLATVAVVRLPLLESLRSE